MPVNIWFLTIYMDSLQKNIPRSYMILNSKVLNNLL